ncbi:epimerase [Robbsia andropogonis]|uniref:Epimerase n=1 Tax=Robbsia andropogonis TaxID=28092 RepID=A0A0F5JVG3_9BURK|nr:NAD-dependent epimerase/dehydratase family protein [Robbsia andropogonis]KKB61858.1 epimerase [Robbsia andropogonis]MCP1118655.1 NAD-dependent epimerase/dehydratase family protein [Robbsia andropogonis]MCP1128122.1 NAD-dependent epimerase/dehydratase family protein [Robbsia andropogonis]
MTHVVVTGAEGFVGRALVGRLLSEGLGARKLSRLTLMDIHFDEPHPDRRVVQVSGSIADAAVRAQAFSNPVDAVFHLASIPGGAAEKDYALGRSINLDATLGMLEDLASQVDTPRFVFASTIAVYGEQLPDTVDEDTLPAPALSYGAQKLMGEFAVADASRRGWVHGCSLRLPGVVARPGDGAGMMSAFMSLLFWKLAAGQPITVPVSREGTAWWISVARCVDNLLHAATVDPHRFNARRTYQMPVLRLSVGDVVDGLAERFGVDRKTLVTYAPDPFIERLFASYPPMLAPQAERLGLRHDGSVEQLITRATSA